MEAWSFGLNGNEELRKVSSAKERMLEDVEVSRSLMKRMKSTGGDDRALGYTSVDRVQMGEEAVHSDGN